MGLSLMALTVSKAVNWWVVLIAVSVLRCPFFLFMGVKLGYSHSGKNAGWGWVRMGCRGRYLNMRGRKWQETGENYLMTSPDSIRAMEPVKMSWAVHVARMGEKCYRAVVGKPDEKRLLWACIGVDGGAALVLTL